MVPIMMTMITVYIFEKHFKNCLYYKTPLLLLLFQYLSQSILWPSLHMQSVWKIHSVILRRVFTIPSIVPTRKYFLFVIMPVYQSIHSIDFYYSWREIDEVISFHTENTKKKLVTKRLYSLIPNTIWLYIYQLCILFSPDVDNQMHVCCTSRKHYLIPISAHALCFA